MKRTLTILALILLPALSFSADSPMRPNLPTFSGNRYVLTCVDGTMLGTLVLDTHTGRVWRLALSEKKSFVLAPVTYLLADGSASLEPIDSDAEVDLAKKLRKEKE